MLRSLLIVGSSFLLLLALNCAPVGDESPRDGGSGAGSPEGPSNGGDGQMEPEQVNPIRSIEPQTDETSNEEATQLDSTDGSETTGERAVPYPAGTADTSVTNAAFGIGLQPAEPTEVQFDVTGQPGQLDPTIPRSIDSTAALDGLFSPTTSLSLWGMPLTDGRWGPDLLSLWIDGMTIGLMTPAPSPRTGSFTRLELLCRDQGIPDSVCRSLYGT